MPKPLPTSLKEAPLDMTDKPAPETPTPAQPEPHDSIPTQHGQPADTPIDTTARANRTQNPVSHTPRQPKTTEPPHTGSAAHTRLSISTNTALGLIGALITIFGSAIIGLILHTLTNLNDRITSLDANLNDRITSLDANLNDRITSLDANLNDRITSVEANLNDRMDTIDSRLTDLSQQQTDMDETLSVLIAILNARREVEAAKAHQIINPE